MPLTIDLPPETERRLRELAAERGHDAASYVRALIELHLSRPAGPTADEALAPVRAEVAASGMSEEELTEFLTEVRDQARLV
ncbi:MAG TPA: hypothetical protein VIL46_04015 [Gemmataceae bacterium]